MKLKALATTALTLQCPTSPHVIYHLSQTYKLIYFITPRINYLKLAPISVKFLKELDAVLNERPDEKIICPDFKRLCMKTFCFIMAPETMLKFFKCAVIRNNNFGNDIFIGVIDSSTLT